MNKNCCFVLIQEFPYFNGETFFDEELFILSKKFEKVIIFSFYGKKSCKYEREIPKNVIIEPLNVKNNRTKNILKGIFSKSSAETLNMMIMLPADIELTLIGILN